MTVRVGAVDIGTNSTRLLVADVAASEVTEVTRRLAITRLGEGVDAGGALRPAALARVHGVLEAFAQEAVDTGAERVLAVATSAVRDAANGLAFLDEIGRRHGWQTRLLSGREEAETTFSGIVSNRSLAAETLVIDIGGGSTELLLGGPHGVSFAESVQAGCVRLTERHLHGDPPGPEEIEALASDVRRLLPPLEAEAAIGVAGTVTTVAAIDLGLERYDAARIHGHRITRDALGRTLELLASLPLRERERVRGLEPGRAPVIVAGVVVLREVMDALELASIEASERDILHGTALLAAADAGRSR